MPAKKKKQRRGKKASPPPVSPELRRAAETRTAVAVTVAWTLALLATLAAEGLGFCCQLCVRVIGPNENLELFAVVMLFVALVSGSVTLALTTLVLRLAKTRPPRFLVQVACVAGILPYIAVLVQSIFG